MGVSLKRALGQCEAPRLALCVVLPSKAGGEALWVCSTSTGLVHSGLSVEELLGLQDCVHGISMISSQRCLSSSGRRDLSKSLWLWSICEPVVIAELSRAS